MYELSSAVGVGVGSVWAAVQAVVLVVLVVGCLLSFWRFLVRDNGPEGPEWLEDPKRKHSYQFIRKCSNCGWQWTDWCVKGVEPPVRTQCPECELEFGRVAR